VPYAALWLPYSINIWKRLYLFWSYVFLSRTLYCTCDKYMHSKHFGIMAVYNLSTCSWNLKYLTINNCKLTTLKAFNSSAIYVCNKFFTPVVVIQNTISYCHCIIVWEDLVPLYPRIYVVSFLTNSYQNVRSAVPILCH